MVHNTNNDAGGTLLEHINIEGNDEGKYSLVFFYIRSILIYQFCKCVQLLYKIICFMVPSQNYFITSILWFYQNSIYTNLLGIH